MLLARSGARLEAPLQKRPVRPVEFLRYLPADRAAPSTADAVLLRQVRSRLLHSRPLMKAGRIGRIQGQVRARTRAPRRPGAWRLSSSEPKMCSMGMTSHSASRRAKAAGIAVKYSPSPARFEQANSRVAAAQRPANLALKFVHRLNGVPAGSPEERLQRAGRLERCALHRNSESAESGSSGGLGSTTLMFAVIEVSPL